MSRNLLPKQEATQVLMDFLRCPLEDGSSILKRFAALPRAVYCCGEKPLERFVYVPGSREDRVLLIAHADSFWDQNYKNPASGSMPVMEAEIVKSGLEDAGLGADDRAGCALAWLLRNSGHSLLILDGEEHGHLGALHLCKQHKKILRQINRHQYLICLDMPGRGICHYHKVPNKKEFCAYIEEKFALQPSDKAYGSDLSYMTRAAAGVNLSIGYIRQHSPQEIISVPFWYETYERLSSVLAEKQPKFRTKSYVRLVRKIVSGAAKLRKRLHIDKEQK